MAFVTPIKIIIADDHPAMLLGLESLIEQAPDIELLTKAFDAKAALAAVRTLNPDIALLDLEMPEGGGISVIQQIHEEGLPCKCIVFSQEIPDQLLLKAMNFGVRGVLIKTMPPQLILQAIRKVYAGGKWLEMDGISRLLERGIEQQRAHETLTSREIELIKLVAVGLRNQEIAKRLFIQEGTVRIHLHNVYKKLNLAGGRGALIAYARDHDLM